MNLGILIILIDNQISLLRLGAFPWNLTLFNKLYVELAGGIEKLVAFALEVFPCRLQVSEQGGTHL